MVTPDDLVQQSGETMDLIWVQRAAYIDDSFDEDNSVIQTDSIQAIASLPGDKDQRSFQGRQVVPTLRLTVLSDLDIRSDRPGRPDRILRSGRLYRVEEVRDDIHPLAGVRKKTVFLAPVPGR